MTEPSTPQESHTYTALELQFCERFAALFARVDAQQPHKGIRVLILRARTLCQESNLTPQAALEQTYQAARERTERRLALLNHCPTKHP